MKNLSIIYQNEVRKKQSKMAAILHSTGETSSSQLRSEIASMNRLDEDAFQTVTEIIFDFLLTSKQPDAVIGRLTELAGEAGMSFGALKSTVRSLLGMLKAAGSRGITAKNLQDDLEELGAVAFINFYFESAVKI